MASQWVGKARTTVKSGGRRALVPARRAMVAAVDRSPALERRTRNRSWLWQTGWTRKDHEDLYASGPDPYGFDRNPGERLKYQLTMDLLPAERFERALEVGAGEGSFTELLAERCDAVVALELSEIAVARGRERLRHRPEVTFERRSIPFDLPDGDFDLVVCSDILYLLEVEVFERGLPRIARLLRPGGALVLVDYCGEIGAPISGDHVHDHTAEVAAELGLRRLPDVEFPYRGPRDGGYRADVFIRDAGTA